MSIMKLHSNCKYLITSFIIVACCLQQYCMGQSSTVRPYKFGFTIDQQQHRSEQRDERGIVMGEFGFITADGIYHVTVYATDEQGRFRILAMKNYPYESPPKTVEVMVQPKIPPKTTTTAKPLTRHNFNTQACSGCFLSNGNNKPKGISEEEKKTGLPNPSGGSPINPTTIKKENPTVTKPAATPGSLGTSLKSKIATKNVPPVMDIIMQKVLPALMDKKVQSEASKPIKTTIPNSKTNAVPSGQESNTSKTGADAVKKSGGGPSSAVNADGDLYRFKYLLDYHGHMETGKRNGDKEGSYYDVGDDNVERTIEYVANEFGYQPRIRWRKLDSNEIKPKENTLKDYEFIWFQQ